MFRQAAQKGFVSVFQSTVSQPLLFWDSQVRSGCIKRIRDNETKSSVLEISGPDAMITTPAARTGCPSLSVQLPFLTIVAKIKMQQPVFPLRLLILDTLHQPQVLFPLSCFNHLEIEFNALDVEETWIQIQMNLADLSQRVLMMSTYMETARISISGHCQLRSVYFTDRVYTNEEKPAAFKFPMSPKKENVKVKDDQICDFEK